MNKKWKNSSESQQKLKKILKNCPQLKKQDTKELQKTTVKL